MSQGSIGGQRVAAVTAAEALRQVYLVAVTGVDILLDTIKGCRISGFVLIRLKGRQQLEPAQRRCWLLHSVQQGLPA